jgi:uncharacterized phage protein gp47/JayE
MATIPTPRSWNQIIGDLVNAFLSRFGLKSLKVGSPVLSILEAAAQSDLRSSQDIFDLLNAKSLDRATGTALDRIGRDEGLERFSESPATGVVTITDSSFVKISSKVYQGQPAPIVGSSTLFVADASSFPASGRVFVGRGTNNYEGPLNYSSKTDNGTYWTLTLSDTTRRFHNLGESVIVGQGGNRAISAGTIAQTSQGNVSDAVKFTTLFGVTIADGETEISNIQVRAQIPGVGSNVGANSIIEFVTPPFTGATITNPLPFTNGLPAEDDTSFRERIKAVRQSRSRGTALAIQTNVQGIIATDENKRLASSSVVIRHGLPTTLYIDDGTGYEETSQGVAIEPLIDRAVGGEQYFQVASARPISKAYLITVNAAPFQLTDSSKLSVKIGGKLYEHLFNVSDFRAIDNATAYEVVSSINANPLLGFSASTVAAGSKVRIFAKADTLEDIEVVAPINGTDANSSLQFAKGRVDTMRLYKNDRLLSKDGTVAVIDSKSFSNWGSFTSGETLTIAVDGTADVTYTFTDQDFIDAKTGFTSVGRNTVSAWASVLNFKIPGITATEINGVLEVISNAGTSARAKLEISGGTLVTPGQMFAIQSASGTSKDYTLDRNTGQICLAIPLEAGDSLSVGTISTRAFVESDVLSPTNIAIGGAKLWFAVDGDAEVISTGLNGATTLTAAVQRLETWGNRVRIIAGDSVFSNVQAGDWMVNWDSNLSDFMQGSFRVAQASSTWVEIERQSMLAGRVHFTATILADNRILVVGGISDNGQYLRSCEIYDPTTNTWTTTGALAVGRAHHTATLTSAGKVVVVGGENLNLPQTTTTEIDATTLSSVEMWDPGTGLWTTMTAMPSGNNRRRHVAGLLTSPNERVAVAAGIRKSIGSDALIASLLLFNVGTNSWTVAANMATPRWDCQGAVLTSSKLLVFGGASNTAGTTPSIISEIFDYNLGTWSFTGTSFTTARRSFASATLNDGRILAAGGLTAGLTPTATAEVFDPAGGGGTGTWSTTNSMSVARESHVMAHLGNNKILAVFGQNGGTLHLTGETWDSGTGLWSATAAPMSKAPRMGGRAIMLSSGNALVMGGSSLGISSPGQMQASAEIYGYSGNAWSPTAGDATQTSFSLASNGVIFVRASSLIQQVSVSSGSNFTALNFVNTMNTQLIGATAKTYRTNTIRVNTKTYELGGDIAMVGTDIEGGKLKIDAGDAVENSTTHQASIQSGNPQAGTPEFGLAEILSADSDTGIVVFNGGRPVAAQDMVVGRKSLDSSHTTASPIFRYGHNTNVASALQSITNSLSLSTLALRSPGVEWIAKDSVYLAAPFATGFQDDLAVLVDQDTVSKRFVTNLFRKLTPVGGTYGATNTYKDTDNSGASVAVAFGLDYDFNDFALYMKSRAKTHSGDSSKTILWRYNRHGPDGDTARLKFVYPTSSGQALAVTTDTGSSYTSISVSLPSGPLKTGYTVRNTSKIGTAAASGALEILSFVFGYSVSSATRQRRIQFNDQTVDFTVGETITGGTSGATATITAIVSDFGAGGVLAITGVAGTFIPGETLTGSLGGDGTANTSQYDWVTLTLTLPTAGGGVLASITNHGFSPGDSLYLNSSNSNFPSGLKTLFEITSATSVSYVESNAFIGTNANIGTVSFDSGAVTLAGASPSPVAIGDFIRFESTSGLPTEYESMTMRIGYYGNQIVQGYVESFSGSNTGMPTWTTLSDTASMKIFGLDSANATASAIASKVRSYADAENSICPVTAVATGSGTGVVSQSSFEEALTADTWAYLTDGVNYVKATISPVSVAGDYQLTFKNAIAADLASNADWANEDVRLVPVTTQNLVNWLNTLTVTGLSSVCAVEEADQAQRLQIASLTPGSAGGVQVQGGSGNSGSAPVSGSASLITDGGSSYALVTARKSDVTGMTAGMWTAIQNASTVHKNIIQSTMNLESWDTNGVMVFTTDVPLWTWANPAPITSKTWQIEKQGNFVCYHFNPFAASGIVSSPDLSGIKEGDWVRITTAASPSANAVVVSNLNQGIYRVIRVDAGATGVAGRAFWIENPNVLEETAEMDVAFYVYDSVMPNDVLSISTDLWGADNKGSWTIETVGQIGGTGAQFANRYTMKVSTGLKTPTAITAPGPDALGSVEYRLVQLSEGTPGKLIKKIRAISPNQVDGRYVDIKFETSAGYAGINSIAGSVISPLDKLAFSTDLALGTDGYAHTIGLIAEANRVIYGDARDVAAYPGVVAAGANVNISGPLVKRITCALNLRIRSGVGASDITDRVRSAVASVVNASGVGESIAISDIINAASKVNGVQAVSIISPTFNSESDMIAVQPYEKPLVLSLEQDIQISFVGD